MPRVFSPIGVWISPDYSEGTNSEVADTIFEKQVGIMFKNSCDEEKLCQVLKAYVEEWGPENVIVSVPRHWSEYSTSSLGASDWNSQPATQFQSALSMTLYV